LEKRIVAMVAVEAATYAIDKPYEYLIPEELAEKVVPGVRVRVDFGRGRRRTEGIVLELHKLSGDAKYSLKPIREVIDSSPVFDSKLIRLALWLREQCFCTFFDVAKAMLPSGVWHKFDVECIPQGSLDDAKVSVASLPGGEEICEIIFNSPKSVKKADLKKLFEAESVEKVLKKLSSIGAVSEREYLIKNVSDKTERLVRIDVSKEEISEYISRKSPRPSVREALALLADMRAVTSHELCYFTGVSPSQLNTLRKNGIIRFEDIEVYRKPKPSGVFEKNEMVLNEKQNAVFKNIAEKIGSGPSCSLLYGVTGSGKTLVYFKLIEEVIARGKKAILLVPEIALTPQLLGRVYAYFGARTAIMHSALSVGERYDEWKRIRNGEVDVVVGTRSAIFSPLSDIGIIILDEEQEDTYKSSSNPRYHAREAAKFRCVSDSALLVLGSATPSVESMYNAKNGKYNLQTLSERFNEKPLPSVIISDLRKALRSGEDGIIGKELLLELEKNIKNGEQSILFLNRRGAGKYLVCDECGEVPGCPNCSAPLVYHSKNNRLMCHHCGYSEHAEKQCPVCNGKMRVVGFGTQRVEEELMKLFPGVGIVRMDTDTTSGKASHEKLLNKFRDEKVPILLGTQMITKGLDFENVTLVGVLSADQAIFNESYKASENAFSLITQVVGRAGRGEKEGRAVIQTYSPKNFIIQTASEQDYDGFFENELQLRELRSLPPFSDIISLTFMAESESAVFDACLAMRNKITDALSGEYSDVTAKVLGPTPLGIVKVGGKYRYKLLICTENNKRSRDLISRLMRDFLKDKKNKEISIIPDINSTDI